VFCCTCLVLNRLKAIKTNHISWGGGGSGLRWETGWVIVVAENIEKTSFCKQKKSNVSESYLGEPMEARESPSQNSTFG